MKTGMIALALFTATASYAAAQGATHQVTPIAQQSESYRDKLVRELKMTPEQAAKYVKIQAKKKAKHEGKKAKKAKHKSEKKSFFEGFKPGKRLFRDIENKKVGGVCAGIATYLGIQDPLWVRVFFIVLVPLWGFTIPLYIILMIILPEAKTAADRLAMRARRQ